MISGFTMSKTQPHSKPRRRSLLLGNALLIAVLPSPLFAQSLLLDHATVHTVSGKTIENGQVLIRDGKIAAVGVSLPANDAKIIDLYGQHLYPGLIAPTTVMGLSEINAVRATRDTTEVGEFTPDVRAWLAVNPDSELIPVARANGITHALPVPLGAVVSGQSGLVALDGWTTEQMAVKHPVALHVFWPNMELNVTPRGRRGGEGGRGQSLEEQAKTRRVKLKALEDFFEEARAYAKAKQAAERSGTETFTLTPAWEAMLPVVRGEIPVMVHADDLREIKAAVNWADANKFKMIVAGGRDAWMVADLLASKKIPVIYENIFTQPSRDDLAYDAPFKAPALLHKAGVTVAFS